MSNELAVQYETSFGAVSLDANYVKEYLVAGNGSITNKEIELFLKLCQAQKLNPFTHEAYIIKYGSQPANIVVGYDTYKRRAEENPNYLYKKSGIITINDEKVVEHQEGTCLYPGQRLIGGWCEVFRVRNNKEVREYQEVSYTEYALTDSEGKPKSTWKSKPCTMIVKCAVSQALRAAFPLEFNGLYTAEEMSNTVGEFVGAETLNNNSVKKTKQSKKSNEKEDKVNEEVANAVDSTVIVEEDTLITAEQRLAMFDKAKNGLGSDANFFIKEAIKSLGYDSTASMKQSDYTTVMNAIDIEIEKKRTCSIDDAQIVEPEKKEAV